VAQVVPVSCYCGTTRQAGPRTHQRPVSRTDQNSTPPHCTSHCWLQSWTHLLSHSVSCTPSTLLTPHWSHFHPHHSPAENDSCNKYEALTTVSADWLPMVCSNHLEPCHSGHTPTHIIALQAMSEKHSQAMSEASTSNE
jgi:hypothetical protein